MRRVLNTIENITEIVQRQFLKSMYLYYQKYHMIRCLHFIQRKSRTTWCFDWHDGTSNVCPWHSNGCAMSTAVVLSYTHLFLQLINICTLFLHWALIMFFEFNLTEKEKSLTIEKQLHSLITCTKPWRHSHWLYQRSTREEYEMFSLKEDEKLNNW